MKNLITIIFLLSTVLSFGQSYKPKKGGGLYNTGKDQIDKGWFFGLGATYMLGYPKETESVGPNVVGQYPTDYEEKPKGKFGLMAEIGLFKMNDRKVINYIDYGISYKWFRGGQDFVATPIPGIPFEMTGSFGDHLISGNFNIGHRFDKNDNTFFVNGLGLNLDYHIITGRTSTPKIPNNSSYQDGPSSILGEMHYFFGIGFKTGKRLIVMPIVETPIFAIFPFNHIVSTHQYSNTRFRPIMLKVRFMFLKKGSKSCPKVYNPMGISPEGGGMK